MGIQELYKINCETKSDINEHLPLLKSYYDRCGHVTEIGVRGGISLSAALVSNSKKVVAIDIENVEVPESEKLEFICKSSLDIEIEETDFLFIDSLHNYSQLKSELELHSKKVNNWIGMHDTVMFGENGEDGNKGLKYAIKDFILENNEWVIEIEKENNNGLTILCRKQF